LNLNADLGEGAGDDEAILACVDSASVACGVHAGSVSITVATALRCLALGKEVGAHPGYDDRANFGRAEVSMSIADLEALIAFQVAGLSAIAPVRYLKAHGALYHRCQHDAAAADVLARVAREHGVGVVGQPGFEILAAAKRARITGHREGFADRLLRSDGRLTPRTQPGAMLDAASAAEQAVALARTGGYDTICVHGDTPGAGQVAAAVRRALDEAGIATSQLGGRL
jgi:UPF0271 protein